MVLTASFSRGAGASKGRTSWQAKAEVEDYISFVGFFIHYIQGLRANAFCSQSPITPGLTLSPIQTPEPHSTALDPADQVDQGMLLILGGYSYGGLITTHLPTTWDILNRFETTVGGSAVSEIRLRAVNLARQWNKDAEIYRKVEQARKSRSHEKLRPLAGTMAMAIGGDESEQASRRPSHEGRLSLDVVRRSIERSRQRLGLRQHSHSSDMSSSIGTEEDLASTKTPLPRTCYLLISPPLPPISMFITMFSGIRSGKSSHHQSNFTQNPTFAVYGDSDFFTSQRKYRRWAESLKAEPGSQFQFQEVPGAGHFWREDGVDDQMRRSIRKWVHGMSSSITTGT